MIRIAVGDRVRITTDARWLTAIVTELCFDSYYSDEPTGAMVAFEDTTLIPNKMRYPLASLEILRSFNASAGKCECGLKFSRDGGKHSDYCPLYQR